MEECIICFEETREFIFFPCAHKVCSECHKRIVRCPICNYTFDPEIQLVVTRVRTEHIQTYPVCSMLCGLFALTIFVSYFADSVL